MRYLGSKTLLLENIRQIAHSYSDQGVFCDPFGGIGTVGSFMKKNGYQVLTGDILYFAHCFQVALIEQNKEFDYSNLKVAYEICSSRDLNRFLNQLTPRVGWLVQEYARERRFFTLENAMHIQACIDCIWEWKTTQLIDELQYNILIASLIQSMDKVANTAGTYYAYLKHFDRKAQQQFQFKLLAPILGEEKSKALLIDAGELVKQQKCDILYLDPPYNERNYGRYYHLPENIALGQIPKPNGKSGMYIAKQSVSDYNSRAKATKAFQQLIQDAKTGCIIFHYTDKGLINIEDAKDILRDKGRIEEFYFTCKGYNTINSSEPCQHHVVKATL